MGKHSSKKHHKKSKCSSSSSSESCECCEIRIVCPKECDKPKSCGCSTCCPPTPCQSSCQSSCQQNCCPDPCCPCTATLTGTKTLSPNPARPDSAATFIITVTNPSNCPANNVVLTDTLPTGLFTSGTVVVSPAGTIIGNTITVNLGTINPGQSVIVTISGTVPTSFTGTATNTATITASNISAPVVVNFPSGGGGGGALTVTKSFSPTSISGAAGGVVNFTLTITNTTANPVTFNLVDVLAAVGASATFTTFPAPSGVVSGLGTGTVTVTNATVLANSSFVVNGTITVPPGSLAGLITNIATVLPISPLGLPAVVANAILIVL